MRREEIWSVSIARITAFFDIQQDITKTTAGYQYQDCRITLTALPPKETARFAVPRTLVVFEGSDEAVSAIYHRFLIQFLTAGG
ncbi:MAG: hypothetical protein J6K99_05805, partial [Peptococcaceae bacterium]|nr:hypothetical protein [Peptococcaceae bacterium]MBO5140819.1 hypothetical protein [Peptococcaceae bacterium]MBP3342020.1 hypothetical protein [Peptococcaceae bacterium]